MKVLKYILIFVMFLINISCTTRGIPIEQQVVYYMENFDQKNYTEFKLDNGDIVYYPNEIVHLVEPSELYHFNSKHYQKIKMKQKVYFVPKNRLLIQQVQNIRNKSKFKSAKVNEQPVNTGKDKFETITVGEPHSIDTPNEIESTLPTNNNPFEQIAH